MELRPIDASNFELVVSWMAQKENYQWLDFGNGSEPLNPIALKFMTQKDSHVLRVFTSDDGEEPIGLVALSNLNRSFKTAMLWYVLGNKSYSGKSQTTRAVSRILTCGFREMGLRSIHAWAVETNIPSIRVLERNHFRFVGRQRKCHVLDGMSCDRLLFDLLASEHKEM